MLLNKISSVVNSNAIALQVIVKNKQKIFTKLLLLGFLLINVGVSSAQNTQTTKNKADSNLKSAARVNPSTLAMEFALPLGSYTGRNGNSIPVSVNYSSKVWNMTMSYTHHERYEVPATMYYDYIDETAVDVVPQYAEKSVAGWTSSLQPVTMTAEMERYNSFGEIYSLEVPGQQQGPAFQVHRVRIRMSDGSSVEFRKDDGVYNCHDLPQQCHNGFAGTYLSTDGSGMRFERSEVQPNSEVRDVLYLPNGGRYIFPVQTTTLPPATNVAEKFIDENGNVTLYNAATGKWTDTLGREIQDPLYNSPSTALPVTYSLKGINNADVTYSTVWKTLANSFESPSMQPKYMGEDKCTYLTQNPISGESLFKNQPFYYTDDQISGRTRYLKRTRACASSYSFNHSPSFFNPVVLAEVVLPDGQKYEFKYNEFGEITKIIYPTGGYERFVYGQVNPMGFTALEVYSQANRGVNQRYVSFDGTTESQTWNYFDSVTGANSCGITIVAPDGSKNERLIYCSTGSAFGFEDPRNGRAKEERARDINGVIRSRTITEWAVYEPQQTFAKRDPKPLRTISIITENGQSLATMTETDYETPGENGSAAPTDLSYFARLNAKQTKPYHYLPLTSTEANADYATAIVDLKNKFYTSGQVAAINQTDYSYDAGYKARGIIGLVTETRSLSPSNPNDVLAKSQIVYDETNKYYSLTDTSTTTGHSIVTGANSNLRGNATTSRTWVKETNTWLETHAQYDNFGNVRKVWDARNDPNHFTETEYSATFKYAYPTKVITPAPGDGTYGTTAGSFATTDYDFYTGLPVSTTNEFNQTTKTEYDSMLRPWRIYAQNFTAPEAQTVYGTPDTNGQLPAGERFVKSRKQIDANNWDEAITWFDGLGRTIKTQAKDSQGDVFVETTYGVMGRPEMVTNPYRAGDTKLWNLTEYDSAGRAWRSRAPVADQNPAVPVGEILSTTAWGFSTVPDYVGTVVTTTDASGRKGRSITNALGQLLRVDEPTATGGTADADLGDLATPHQPTYYKYDNYGKMVRVQQGKTGETIQNRYFLYDSLGRLIRVRQPEQEVNTALNTTQAIDGNTQWSAGFTYDNLGNLITTRDAKGTLITNTYDKAGRVTTRTYTDEPSGVSTPAVSYYYDGIDFATQQTPYNYAKGKLTKVFNTVSQTRYTSFDHLGRLKAMEQRTPLDGQTVAQATPYVTSYNYNFSSAFVEEIYPSGRIVKTEFEADGDLARVTSQKAGTTVFKPYVSNFSYTAAGGITQMKLGNGRWETARFNNRLQVEELGLGNSATDASVWKVNYAYGELAQNGTDVETAKNTGNIAKQTISFNGLVQFVQTYRYDSLYRLKEAKETSGSNQTWIQQHNYDRFGNRERTGSYEKIGITETVQDNRTFPTTNKTDNRFDTGQGYIYDKSGNIKGDVDTGTLQTRDFIFNGDNKQTEVKRNGLTVGRYFYDGEGKRVKKVTDSETTVFVYSSGKLIAEYSTQLSQNPSVNYTTTDHLGSPRVITNEFGQVKSRRDFMPFGEELAGVGGRTGDTGQKYSSTKDDTRQKFTGYQNDIETGLDFAEARMYNNAHGRFTAVDPLLASGESANPQTFNRYVYVANSPLILTDPTGLRGDYYDRDLNYLGTDGIDDGKYYYADVVKRRKKGKIDVNNIVEFTISRPASFGGVRAPSGNDNIRALLGGFNSGLEQVQDAAVTGAKNVPINLLNTATDALTFQEIGIPLIVSYRHGLWSNPLQISRFEYSSQRAQELGSAVEAGIPFGAGVAVGSVFARSSPTSLNFNNCFIAGVLIHTEKGLAAIEDIKAGDKVLSYNEDIRQVEYQEVVRLFRNTANEFLKIQVEGEASLIEVTLGHPFYVHRNKANLDGDNDGDWVLSKSLKVGDFLRDKTGVWKPILSIKKIKETLPTYNFEVWQNHNYFVGENGLLVHNDSFSISRLRSGNDVYVNSYEKARQLLNEMPELRPGNANGFNWDAPDSRGTFRGDLMYRYNTNKDGVLISKESTIHRPNQAPNKHSLNPHYNLYFHDGTKSAIIIQP